MPINSQNPTLGNSFLGSGRSGLNPISNEVTFLPARVMEVSLTPSRNGKSIFQLTKGWYGIGAIKFEYLTQAGPLTNYPRGDITYPLDINFRQLPLVNEIVFIILGPSNRRTVDGSEDNKVPYYTNTVNMWNGVHLNASPSTGTKFPSTTNVNSLEDIQDGEPNKATSNIPDPNPVQMQLYNPNPIQILFRCNCTILIKSKSYPDATVQS